MGQFEQTVQKSEMAVFCWKLSWATLECAWRWVLGKLDYMIAADFLGIAIAFNNILCQHILLDLFSGIKDPIHEIKSNWKAKPVFCISKYISYVGMIYIVLYIYIIYNNRYYNIIYYIIFYYIYIYNSIYIIYIYTIHIYTILYI